MATHPLLHLARRAIAAQAEGHDARKRVRIGERGSPRACFVSLHLGARLRGCIGTLRPTQECVELEVLENALAAATRDPRFPPVGAAEVPALRLSIDLLEPPEPVSSPDELDPLHWGLIVRQGARSGVLLPDLPGVRTVEQQIGICREKAGIAPDAPVTLERFRVERIEE